MSGGYESVSRAKGDLHSRVVLIVPKPIFDKLCVFLMALAITLKILGARIFIVITSNLCNELPAICIKNSQRGFYVIILAGGVANFCRRGMGNGRRPPSLLKPRVFF